MKTEWEDKSMHERAAMILPVLSYVPNNVHCEFSESGICLQASTQEEVRARRGFFPHMFWTKEYSEACRWWEYSGTFRGVPIKVYAVREAPPTCHAVEEVVQADAYVQVDAEGRELPEDPTKRYAWVKKPKTVTKWVCGDGAAVEG